MPAGQPTALTPEVLEDVRRLLPTCLYIETVADYLGLERTTVRKWIKRGSIENKRIAKGQKAAKAEEKFREFFLVYKKAIAEGLIYDLGIIKKAAATQWQAAAWRAERRYPGKCALRERQLVQDLTDQVKELQKAVNALTDSQHQTASG